MFNIFPQIPYPAIAVLQKTTNNTTTYYHQVVAATIVCPGIKQVIPLAPEPIQNTDGSTKQDCEINAGKRIVKKIRSTHPKLKIIIQEFQR